MKQARRFVDEFPASGRGLCLDRSAGDRQDASRGGGPAPRDHHERRARPFYDTRDLLRVIRSTYNPLVRTAEMDILRPVMEADLLVLDDLGSEKTSEWVEETMNLIVNTRYNERRHTIFTSNYDDTPDDARSHAGRSRSASASAFIRGCTRCASSSSTTVRTIATCRPTAGPKI